MISNLKKLKQEHEKLLSGYGQILSDLSYLPLFVFPTRGKQLEEGKGLWRILHSILKILSFLFGMWSLKPLTRFFIETHIKAKIQDIKTAYLQNAATIHSRNKNYQAWSATASSQIETLAESLLSWKSLIEAAGSTIVTLGTFILTLLGLNNLADIAPKLTALLSNIKQIPVPNLLAYLIGLLVIAGFSINLIDYSFTTKRKLFHFSTKGKTIYEVEDDLFRLLNRGKAREFPVETASQTIFAEISIIVFWLIMTWPDTFKVNENGDFRSNLRFLAHLLIIILIICISYISVTGGLRKNRHR